MREQQHPAKGKMKVIFDSNAFFVPLQLRIDIFEELKTLLICEFQPIILSPIKKELERLAKESSPKKRKNAAWALELAGKCSLIETDCLDMPPDDVIVEMAKKWRCPVFTNDRPLRKRLRDINMPVIYVRQKTRLAIEGRLWLTV